MSSRNWKKSLTGVTCIVMTCCLNCVMAKSTPLKAESVVLVSAGTSRFHISITPESSICEKFAAEELSKYIKQITGVTLKVQEELKFSDNTIRIAGNDEEIDGFQIMVTPNQVLLQGSSKRGSLYAVYQLLEDMGCRWFYIGALGEVVPRLDKIELSQGRRTEKASFPERSVMIAFPHYYNQFDEWIDLCGKLKINNIAIYAQPVEWWSATSKKYLCEIEKRGIILEWGGHLMPSFVPRELFKNHPEYFRVNEKGEPNASLNFCPSSGSIEVLKENFKKYISSLGDLKHFRYFHAWADDVFGGGWCNCAKCKGLSPSEQNMLATNALAEALSANAPNSFVANLAYHDSAEVSQKVRPRQNVFLFHAPRERCYVHALDDPQCRRNREEYLPKWEEQYKVFKGKGSNTLHCFEYYTDGILNWQMQPLNMNVIPADARYYHKMGVKVWQNLMVGFRDWHSPPLSLVIFARAAWNADIEGKKVLKDFCHYYYGENMAALMEDYYLQAQKSFDLFFESDAVRGVYQGMTLLPLDEKTNEIVIPQHWKAQRNHKQLSEKLSTALKKVKGGIYAERLQRELDVCELHDLILLMTATQDEGHFLANQFLNGKIGKEEGKRALEVLDQWFENVKNVKKWIERFPEEQKLWIGGWQGYLDSSYVPIIIFDRDRVKEKLDNNLLQR